MICPYCQHKEHLELAIHSEGFSDNLVECSDCGALLHLNKDVLETVHGPTSLQGRPEPALA